jgi:hypothetical protein
MLRRLSPGGDSATRGPRSNRDQRRTRYRQAIAAAFVMLICPTGVAGSTALRRWPWRSRLTEDGSSPDTPTERSYCGTSTSRAGQDAPARSRTAISHATSGRPSWARICRTALCVPSCRFQGINCVNGGRILERPAEQNSRTLGMQQSTLKGSIRVFSQRADRGGTVRQAWAGSRLRYAHIVELGSAFVAPQSYLRSVHMRAGFRVEPVHATGQVRLKARRWSSASTEECTWSRNLE